MIKRTGRLSLRHALDMLEQTGRALQVAHAAGLVHRDVKPGNILITPTGQVKLTDFGIAKAVDAAPGDPDRHGDGYRAVHCARTGLGEDATAASDVYSLGVVGYEAVSGKRPFTGDGALTVAMKHIKETPARCRRPSAQCARLIEITLVKNRGCVPHGGQFADAVAAVRSLAPAAAECRTHDQGHPVGDSSNGGQAGARGGPVGSRGTARPPAHCPAPSQHRPPSAAARATDLQFGTTGAALGRRVLGALAIISAILIVLADRERRSNTPVDQTITDTVVPGPLHRPSPPGGPTAVTPAARRRDCVGPLQWSG